MHKHRSYKNKKTLFNLFCATAIATSACCVTPVMADDMSHFQEEKNRIENEKNKIETEKKELEKEKDKANSEADDLDNELTTILSDIDRMELEAVALNDEIDQNKADLEIAEEKQSKQYDDMKLRVQYMYENQTGTVEEAIFSASDMSDCFEKVEYVQKIYEYDRKELEALAQTTKEIEDISVKLSEDYDRLAKSQEEAVSKRNQLDQLLESKKDEIQDLSERIAKAQSEIAKKEAEEQEIKAAEEEARRKAAEEEARRKAAEEEAARLAAQREAQADTQAAPSSNTNNSSGGTYEQVRNNSGSGQTVSNSSGSSSSYSEPVQAAPAAAAPAPAQSSSGSSSGSAIVSTAYNYLGVPYVWGGTSPSGFDCSGLVQYVYRQNGISLPRTSGAQAGVGYGVSLSAAQPGDIVCYAGHVAIYIGNGNVIHAPYPGRSVEICSATNMGKPVTTVRRVV